MPRLIDISVPLREPLAIWPGSHGVHRSWTQRFADGDDVNVTRLDMDVHAGTHVESPLHFMPDGSPLEHFPLDRFIGEAWVADLRGTSAVGAEELENAGIPIGAERVLLRTDNSALPRDVFSKHYSALTVDGAQWVAAHGVRLLGIDYLSVQRYSESPETHIVLMREDTVILEGLDLSTAPVGRCRLICFPLSLPGAEAAPARAVLEVAE